jgi:hypothetical protein
MINIPSENADTSNEKETPMERYSFDLVNRNLINNRYYMASRLKLMVLLKRSLNKT